MYAEFRRKNALVKDESIRKHNEWSLSQVQGANNLDMIAKVKLSNRSHQEGLAVRGDKHGFTAIQESQLQAHGLTVIDILRGLVFDQKKIDQAFETSKHRRNANRAWNLMPAPDEDFDGFLSCSDTQVLIPSRYWLKVIHHRWWRPYCQRALGGEATVKAATVCGYGITD